MKKVLLSLAIVATVFTANAQKKSSDNPLKFSVGLDAGYPIGDIGDFSSFAIGGSVQGDYTVAEKFAVTLNAGYLNFSGKDGAESFSLIPVLAGAKYFFSENFYGHAQLGVSFGASNTEGTNFTYAPSVGYQITPNFDIAAKYLAISGNGSTTSTIGLRVAYTF